MSMYTVCCLYLIPTTKNHISLAEIKITIINNTIYVSCSICKCNIQKLFNTAAEGAHGKNIGSLFKLMDYFT